MAFVVSFWLARFESRFSLYGPKKPDSNARVLCLCSDSSKQDADDLSKVRVIVVGARGARNVGSIARVMKNFGLSSLTLVKPECEWDGPEAVFTSMRASDIIKNVSVVSSLGEALINCSRAVATTARNRSEQDHLVLENPRAPLRWLLENEDADSAIIFGNEESGLSNDELLHAQRFLTVPSADEYPTLNLA
eukprot:CAMPEP_0184363738 /NCGR_PEP_ID=MMETSP1089-20130417/141053_1 /TAXON_ID=38269 ORGANISM="Gloeochaete wittrockiana, Strain SAG46.84" /NCGR_SAMPLE_ID=MMETSP1089 /ASSEMBLY_ACC=CAM_ASM_000445 /LENGTH=191 /DNA_ID=CAMNT_0026704347 /DNA_START=11 /DNA_END=583 /DNA_ORIENTATION=-